MKLSKGVLFLAGFLLASATVVKMFSVVEHRTPASLVGGTANGTLPTNATPLPTVNPYNYSQIGNHYGSALYNEQVFRQTQSSDELLLQALKVERSAAIARNDVSIKYPNNIYDQRIRDVEHRMTMTRLQQGYNLNNSYLQMAYTLASTRNGLSAQQLQLAQAQLQQMASLSYLNMSGTGSLYETPTLESPYLTSQVGANNRQYAPLPTIEIPTIDNAAEEIPDDVDDIENSKLIAVPVAPTIAQ